MSVGLVGADVDGCEESVDIKLCVTIDPNQICKEDLLRGIDQLFKHSDGVRRWGEIGYQSILNRKFQHIGECPFCGGVTLNFRDEVLTIGELTREDLIRFRKLVADGSDLDFCMNEFDDLRIEEFDFWECENCGHSDSCPTKGGP